MAKAVVVHLQPSPEGLCEWASQVVEHLAIVDPQLFNKTSPASMSKGLSRDDLY